MLNVKLIFLMIILSKMKQGYSSGMDGSRVNHLVLMDYLKLCGGDEKKIGTLVKTIKLVTDGMIRCFGIHKCIISELKRGGN